MLDDSAETDKDASGASCPVSSEAHGFNLFLVGFIVLFLELACIRWFAAHVIFLQFFTNVVLLACFLGMSCGCLAARHKRDWLALFPHIAASTVAAALVILWVFDHWTGLAVDTGNQASPQQVFFGTEYRNPDVAQFVIPIDYIAAVFFVCIALMFVGLGQVLGRAFDAYPNRVLAYTLNIGGSLAGIAAFSLISLVQAPPLLWFLISCAGVAYLLRQAGKLTLMRSAYLVTLLALVTIPGIGRIWSPYYAIDYDPHYRFIDVNNIGHQAMVPFDSGGSAYSLIHLLHKAVGGAPFDNVLIIGAGSGNDIAHALRFGAKHIDAVEIDPAIQRIGIKDHPDQPYADPRVSRHLDDGRHFLRTTSHRYDLVVYALVDSLILHSGYANIRLESYLFTEEALKDIKRVLKPGGIFVTYNYFRQGWVVERIAAMAESVFGCKPEVISLPHRETMPASARAGFTIIVAGCNPKIANAFASGKTFWLNKLPPRNLGVDGFKIEPAGMKPEERQKWQKIAPATLVHDAQKPRFATDDWPFLYLRGRLIPDLTLRSMFILGLLGAGMVFLFMPKGRRRLRLDMRMFFLGAGFMLLETKAVVQLALLFGSTWIVNSMVFFTVLVLILLANFYVLKAQPSRFLWYYLGLFALLGCAIAVPLDLFLGGGMVWRYIVPCVLALGPMLFAGVIFALSFRGSRDPDVAFGSNIAGSVVGGLAESVSMLTGFRYLLLLAIAFYLLSAWPRSPAQAQAAD
jgi:SAM-dependent methyltransferase